MPHVSSDSSEWERSTLDASLHLSKVAHGRCFGFAVLSMIWLLVKFEMTERILHDEQLVNRRGFMDDALVAYARGHAYGTGKFE